jgi:transcriptional regulator GlxA family with amidase domain
MKLEGIIEAYYADNLSSEQIAKLMSVSKRQLSRIVQKRYGTTLRHVIMKKRLSVAAVMLENTHVSIQEIANNVGFNDVSVFRREFRSYYCATPTEYRELMKNSKIKRD